MQDGYSSEPIASGRTADVYELSDALIVKLFHQGVSLKTVESERQNTAIARIVGLSVPAVHGIISRSGRDGLVFDRVVGTQMMQAVLEDSGGQAPQRTSSPTCISR